MYLFFIDEIYFQRIYSADRNFNGCSQKGKENESLGNFTHQLGTSAPPREGDFVLNKS
jgi:hypothetical protein